MLGSPVKSWHWLQNSAPRLRTLLFKVDIYYQCALCLNSGEVTYFLWFQGRQQIAANVIEYRLVRCAPLYVTRNQALRAWILEFEMSVHRICV